MSNVLSPLQRQQEISGSLYEACAEIGRGLMRGNRENLQLGYGWESACLTVIDLAASDGITLTDLEKIRLAIHLAGFARGITGSTPATYREGTIKGVLEDTHYTYPSTV